MNLRLYMTKLLHVPSGQYISFAGRVPIGLRTVIYEESEWDISIYEAIDQIVQGLQSKRFYDSNLWLSSKFLPCKEEFEIIHD